MRSRQRPNDSGATAVEFALLAPLVFLVLFGIVQYGYGLFQLQAFNATVDDAARIASTGVLNCSLLDTRVRGIADRNGLDPAEVVAVELEWLDATGTGTVSLPDRSGNVRISATYMPFDLGMPMIPFPATFTEDSFSKIQDITNSTLPGCS